MGDYTEHLITQAGGDGEPEALDLDAIQARAEQKRAGVNHLPEGIMVTPSGKLVVEW